MEQTMRRASMSRRRNARVFRNVVDWLDSLPAGKRNLLKKTAVNAERLRKVSHG
jgi:hypothetical protein